jgi:hypothetical protein
MRKRGWSGWSGRFLHFGEDLPHRILGNIVVGDFATEFAPQLVGDFACDQTVTHLKAVHQPGVDLGSLGVWHVGHQRWVAHHVLVNCAVSRGASWPGQRTSRTLSGVCNLRARPRGATTMQTDAHNMGREERRALLEQRRAAVARQLRRLAIELADLDRQLDEIERSER